MLPGTGIIFENPLFTNNNSWNFSLLESSPCINSGSPDFIDFNGSISDIGAIPYSNLNCSIPGDLNYDNVTNVIDVIDLINCILYDIGCSTCFDINIDNEFNILDILGIVNIIIN